MQSDAERTALIRCCGDDLLSIAIATTDPAACQQLANLLRDSGHWLECVAGINSVVVQFDATDTAIDVARGNIEALLNSYSPEPQLTRELIEIPVCYGGEYGPDLERLCEQLQMSPDDVIALHARSDYHVDMIGFTPGFAYIGGLDEALNVPRLAQPRLHVPAGSVGIADGRTGVYALPGPGGWPIIGRTSLCLFEPSSDQPFLLRAGCRVRFKPVKGEEFDAMTGA